MAEIVSVTRIYNLVKNDSLKKFEFIPISPHKPETQQELDSIRSLIYSLPFYEGLVYNKSTSAYLMALTLDKKTINSKDRDRLISEISETVGRFTGRTQVEAHFSGLPYIRTLIAKKLENELRLFVILAAGFRPVPLHLFQVNQGGHIPHADRDDQRGFRPGTHGHFRVQDHHAHIDHPASGYRDRGGKLHLHPE